MPRLSIKFCSICFVERFTIRVWSRFGQDFRAFRVGQEFLDQKIQKCEKATLPPAFRFAHSREVMSRPAGVVEGARWDVGISENELAAGCMHFVQDLEQS